MPNYMLLLYAPEPSPAEQEERDAELPVWYELLDSLRDEGLLVANGRLDPPDSATTLRIREGEKDISDGPFAETKEILGGYFILECRDLDHALESAARVPLARAFREEWASILATLIRHVGNFQLAERRSPSRWRSAGSRAAGRRGNVPISIAALTGVRPAEAGIASGLITTSQQVGGALGIAALSAIATSTTAGHVAAGSAAAPALTDGFHAAFAAGTATALAGLLVALVVLRRRDLARPAPAVQSAFEAA